MNQHHSFSAIAPLLLEACLQEQSELQVAQCISCVVNPKRAPEALSNSFERHLSNFEACDSVNSLIEGFKNAGFKKKSLSRVTAQHSDLVSVIDRKEGIPITLAVLFITTARKFGLTANGLNYPGHFLLQIDGLVVDPLEVKVVSDTDVVEKAQRLIASPYEIALRMLNNLKVLAFASAELDRALDLIDLQLHVSSEPDTLATLHYEKGEVWLKLQSIGSALNAFSECLSQANSPQLKAHAERKIRNLKGQAETRH
ncbi:MAG: regulator of sirC expression with transglutaminase-like and TPR domain [Limisphaerales bacterium]|jgi:regulator of sirC expression with transglutaminase-like and TPR domain